MSGCESRHCYTNTSSCDHVYGKCEGGCEPGYEGKDCIKGKSNAHFCPLLGSYVQHFANILCGY